MEQMRWSPLIRSMGAEIGLAELHRLEVMVNQELRQIHQPAADWNVFVPYFCDAYFDRSRREDLISLGLSLHAYLAVRQRDQFKG